LKGIVETGNVEAQRKRGITASAAGGRAGIKSRKRGGWVSYTGVACWYLEFKKHGRGKVDAG